MYNEFPYFINSHLAAAVKDLLVSYKNIYNYFYQYVAALLSNNRYCVVDVD